MWITVVLGVLLAAWAYAQTAKVHTGVAQPDETGGMGAPTTVNIILDPRDPQNHSYPLYTGQTQRYLCDVPGQIVLDPGLYHFRTEGIDFDIRADGGEQTWQISARHPGLAEIFLSTGATALGIGAIFAVFEIAFPTPWLGGGATPWLLVGAAGGGLMLLSIPLEPRATEVKQKIAGEVDLDVKPSW
jgi:hypothetical protein